MPKCKPLTQSQRDKASWAASDNQIRMQIGMLIGASGMKKKGLAEALGVSVQTLYNWERNPGIITVKTQRLLNQIGKPYGLEFHFM